MARQALDGETDLKLNNPDLVAFLGERANPSYEKYIVDQEFIYANGLHTVMLTRALMRPLNRIQSICLEPGYMADAKRMADMLKIDHESMRMDGDTKTDRMGRIFLAILNALCMSERPIKSLTTRSYYSRNGVQLFALDIPELQRPALAKALGGLRELDLDLWLRSQNVVSSDYELVSRSLLALFSGRSG